MCNTALVTVQPHPKEIPGTNPAARSPSNEVLRSSQYCAPDFELLRFRDEEAGEESEDEAAVDVIEEQVKNLNEPDEAQRYLEHI